MRDYSQNKVCWKFVKRHFRENGGKKKVQIKLTRIWWFFYIFRKRYPVPTLEMSLDPV